MQTLTNYIKNFTKRLKLRNLNIDDIDESLRNLEKTTHFNDRRNAKSDENKQLNIGFKTSEIFDIIDKCSDKIETMLLNNPSAINNDKFKITIIKYEGNGCLCVSGLISY